MVSGFQKFQFTIVLVVFQIIFFVLFGLFGKYSLNAMPGGPSSTNFVNTNYPMFQDVHVMIFIGFGFLMVFLRRYGFSAVSMNLLLSCFVIQWGIIVRGFWSKEFETDGKFTISVVELVTADFAAAVILITMGALLGKLSPTQYVIMSFIEVPVALTIEHVVVHYLEVNDIGGSMVVHAFGAYFGLALSFVISKRKMIGHEHEGSNYNSDIFAMIGALFLWVFWPTFNAVVAAPEDARHRAVLNTYLSLCACTVVTFLLSQLVDCEHKMRFSMTHIANSTLAGGVAIGTTANVVLEPLHALLVGSGAAIISVFGFAYLTPFLARKCGIHDTCGVNNLHGMPGLYAGILGFVFAAAYDPGQYELSLSTIYPAVNSTLNPNGREMIIQACYQLAGLAVVFGSAVVSGAITGIILKLKIWNQVRDKEFYADGDYFEVPEDYDFTTRIISKIDHVELTEHTALTNKETQ
ncbi:Ammonium transporter Rh type A [Toxocara canis]|uniref:Ammonium transporter Rh type A n=2 Tax=Toxocara canis TaxID=6265 RepID=A0A0B2VA67_TOXCA|nr:Ammonium transporter Rh type A [Toxocara canis]